MTLHRTIPRCLAAAIAALVLGHAAAQPYPTPPRPGPPRPLVIEAPSEATLPNGLRVVVARRSGVPLVTAMLVVRAGSETDPPSLAGLSSMTASLLTQGTRRRQAPEIAAAAESLGGSLESSAGWNQSTIAITVTTPRLAQALDLVAEVAREPTFAPAEIERLRAQALDALKVRYAEPGSIAALAAARLAFGGGAWGHPASGTPTSLGRIGRDDLVAHHRASFRPDRAVLILAGDIDAAGAERLARAAFGRWTAPGGPVPAPVAPPAPPAAAPVLVVDMAGTGQAGVVVALPLPTASQAGDDWPTGAVVDTVLGSGYSSRLNQEIRIKRGLSYGVDSNVDLRGGAGLFQVAAQTKSESAAEVVGLVQAELDRIVAEPVPVDELKARKATLIGGFSRSVETTAGLAAVIRGLVVRGRPPAELKTRMASLEAVTPADVQRYAAAYLGRGARRVVVAGEAARFVDALKPLAADVTVVPQAELDLDSASGLRRP